LKIENSVIVDYKVLVCYFLLLFKVKIISMAKIVDVKIVGGRDQYGYDGCYGEDHDVVAGGMKAEVDCEGIAEREVRQELEDEAQKIRDQIWAGFEPAKQNLVAKADPAKTEKPSSEDTYADWNVKSVLWRKRMKKKHARPSSDDGATSRDIMYAPMGGFFQPIVSGHDSRPMAYRERRASSKELQKVALGTEELRRSSSRAIPVSRRD